MHKYIEELWKREGRVQVALDVCARSDAVESLSLGRIMVRFNSDDPKAHAPLSITATMMPSALNCICSLHGASTTKSGAVTSDDTGELTLVFRMCGRRLEAHDSGSSKCPVHGHDAVREDTAPHVCCANFSVSMGCTHTRVNNERPLKRAGLWVGGMSFGRAGSRWAKALLWGASRFNEQSCASADAFEIMRQRVQRRLVRARAEYDSASASAADEPARRKMDSVAVAAIKERRVHRHITKSTGTKVLAVTENGCRTRVLSRRDGDVATLPKAYFAYFPSRFHVAQG